MDRIRFVAAAFGLGLLLAACASSGAGEGSGDSAASGSTFGPEAIAIRASTDLATGPERLLVGVSLPDGTRLGSPDHHVVLSAAPFTDPSAVQEKEGLWTWMVPGSVGIYRASFDFDVDGLWEVTVIPESGDALDPVPFSVVSDTCRAPDASKQGYGSCAPRIGDKAPAVPSPTLNDTAIEDLTTDPDPDERFYQVSLDEALGNGKQTVVVFSTPAYCTSAACGPLLDNLKDIIGENTDVDFVHVEVFTGFNEPGFAPDASHLAPAVTAYTLPTEPWVFVADTEGVIVARFEGVMDPVELAPYLG